MSSLEPITPLFKPQKAKTTKKPKYNKDLALLNMLDEQTLLGLLGSEMGGDTFIDESRLKLQTQYPTNLFPNERQVIDAVYMALDAGEDPNQIIADLNRVTNDPNDLSIPKLDPESLTQIVGGVVNSAQQKMRSASSGKSSLDVLSKLGVPEFAPLLSKIGRSQDAVTAPSPYAGMPKEVSGYQNDLEKFVAQTAGLQKATTKGPDVDWATATVPNLEFLKNTPLEILQGLGGKKIPVGKAADVGAKALRFAGGFMQGVMPFGLPGGLAKGGQELGKVNKTGTGWEKTWGSKTESPESVKKRQALAIAALKKNQKDIANREKWAADAIARQAKLDAIYKAAAASVPKQNVQSEYDIARNLLAKAMRG